MATPKKKKAAKKTVLTGAVHIYTTFNNAIVTLTDTRGNTLAWASCGSKGFKGSKKNTPFAAQVAAEEVMRRSRDFGMKAVEVYVTGPGGGREAALRSVATCGLKVLAIKDITPVPHNGCRPPKARRV